jgi:hypothetical protein
VPLKLHPQKEAAPIIAAFRDTLNEKGLNRIKNMLGLEQNLLMNALVDIDKDELSRLFERAGAIDELSITRLWTTMREQVYRLQIAETLDIVGLFESSCGRDLLDGPVLERNEILHLSKYFPHLLIYITELKI